MNLAVAQQAFDSTWTGFDTAFHHLNLKALGEYATPEMVLATAGTISCGCGPWKEKSHSVELSVPIEHSYPLSFLAEVAITKPVKYPFVEEVVLTKSSPQDRWRVAYLVDYTGTSRYLTASGVQPAPIPPFDTSIIGGQFATFFESYANSGVPPTGISWPLEGATQQEVQRYLGVKKSIAQLGDTQGPMTFAATDNSPLFAYPGGDIMCGAFHASVQITTPPGSPTVQPPDRSQWGPTLASGSYTTLDKQQLRDYCVTVSPQGLVTPISFFGGTYSIAGSA